MREKETKKDFLAIDTPKDLLITLFMIGGSISAVALTPAVLAPAFAIQAFQKDSERKRKYSQAVHYARRHKLIYFSEKEQKLKLTKRGVEQAKQNLFSRIDRIRTEKKSKKWDGLWRLLIFDIEHDRRKTRNAIRNAAKRIGMVQLQKSIWLYPFDISEELKFLGKMFLIDENNVRVILAKDIGDDRQYRKYFKV